MTTYNLAKENSRELTKVRLCSLLFNVLKMNVVTSLSRIVCQCIIFSHTGRALNIPVCIFCQNSYEGWHQGIKRDD